jgi:ATP-binding cassette, subfamily B, bacterial
MLKKHEVNEEKTFHDRRTLFTFIKRLFKYSRKYPKLLIIIISATVIAAVADAVYPLVWFKFIDNAISPAVQDIATDGYNAAKIKPFMQKTLQFGGIYVIIAFIEVVCIATFNYASGKINACIIFDIRRDLIHKYQQLSNSYYSKSSIGWLVARITSDVDRLAELITHGFQNFVNGCIMVVFFQVVMYIYNWKLALITTVSLPFLMLVSVNIRKQILKNSRLARRFNSMLIAKFTENINGIELTKSTHQEERAFNELSGLNTQLKKVSFKASLYNSFYQPLILVVGSIAVSFVLYYGGMMALMPGGITVGLLAAFFGYARSIFQPINELTRVHAMAQDSLAAGERIFSILDEKIEIYDHAGAMPILKIKGHVELQDLNFHYVPGVPILQDFNLSIRPGESIALAGHTGCGKSTIINLIARLYEPVSGRVLIDGANYMGFFIESYRSKIGLILQQPHIFSGSIRDNIKYGNIKATDKEILHSLHLIGAYDLAEKLDIHAGEEGAFLSEGEKQIVSLARVIIKDPQILLIDEATSYIDAINEAKIQKGIDYLIKTRTSVIVAHRLSTIKNCDRILYMEKGKVLEEGSHEHLMDKAGHYANLYSKQFLIA